MIKLNKKSIVAIILIFVICMVSSIAYADGAGNFEIDFESNDGDLTNVKGFVNNTAATIISSMRIICATIAVVILLVIAMKYMTSAPGDRADIKKHAIHYVISAVILFGVTGILTLISNFAGIIGS